MYFSYCFFIYHFVYCCHEVWRGALLLLLNCQLSPLVMPPSLGVLHYPSCPSDKQIALNGCMSAL